MYLFESNLIYGTHKKLKTDALCEYKVTTLNGISFLRDEQYNVNWKL